jgi:DNA-directed RNA polymerase subunit RPC12/RpoP
MNEVIFKVMFTVVPFLVITIFIFTILMMFSPRLRAKLIGLQIKTMKHVTNDNKDDMVDIGTNLGDVVARTGKNILDRNEDSLRDISTRGAKISEVGIETMAKAFKKGFSSDEKSESEIKCPKCGSLIDKDSVFCKECGKKIGK